uniref:Uncharacterized protein n=1 Tax=viral metagenome TaxID=1070528 RepID=A0A6C0FAY6_9ZZZZ|tara:strand:- start:23382 stop:23744 length:363 start_codon:yes stop_codon:yes gene_type:complete
MENFKSNVVLYSTYDEETKELNERLRNIREKKQGLHTVLVTYMIDNNIDCCNLPNGSRLVLKTQVQISPINKEHIQGTLTDFFKTPLPKDTVKMAEETTNAILNNRESSEKHVLKMVKKK